MSKTKGRWVKCLGCGQPAGLFPDGLPEHDLPPGTVMHSKPDRLAGVPNSVPCELYQSSSAEAFMLLHAAEPEIENVNHETLRPIT